MIEEILRIPRNERTDVGILLCPFSKDVTFGKIDSAIQE